MMDRTDRHFRVFMRQLTRRTLLYTEMITTGAIIHGDRPRHLDFDPVEHPLALQLGGDDPAQLAECAKIAEDWGYDEINLNVGCPSDRVQSGSFGACLMARPERVAEGVAAMRARVRLPVTVKHRIGIDDLDRYEDMLNFVDVVSAAGADRFSVHARKAILGGLSPAENRTIPPLRWPEVHRLKQERPGLLIEINGGIRTLDEAALHLAHVDAVMIGRAAVDDPWIFADADRRFFGEREGPAKSRFEAVEGLYGYADALVARGGRLHHLARHLLTLFQGIPGARAFRRHLSEAGQQSDAGAEVLRQALARIREPAGAPISARPQIS